MAGRGVRSGLADPVAWRLKAWPFRPARPVPVGRRWWWRGATALAGARCPCWPSRRPGCGWRPGATLVPWLLLIRRAPSAREAALRGWYGAVGFLLGMHYWLLPDLTVFIVPVVAGLALLWVPWGALAWSVLSGPMSWRRAVAAVLVLPAGWVAIEAVRSWSSLGGPPGAIAPAEQRFDAAEAITRDLPPGHYDLVVWGESSVGLDLDRRPDLLARLRRLSPAEGSDLLVNVDALDASGAIHKTSVLIGPDGVVSRYEKMRLVPFGEYIPFRRALGWLPSITRAAPEDRARGQGLVVMRADGIRFTPLVCFESAFPDMSRRAALDPRAWSSCSPPRRRSRACGRGTNTPASLPCERSRPADPSSTPPSAEPRPRTTSKAGGSPGSTRTIAARRGIRAARYPANPLPPIRGLGPRLVVHRPRRPAPQPRRCESDPNAPGRDSARIPRRGARPTPPGSPHSAPRPPGTVICLAPLPGHGTVSRPCRCVRVTRPPRGPATHNPRRATACPAEPLVITFRLP